MASALVAATPAAAGGGSHELDDHAVRGGEVIITPLGAQAGELCAMDRAMLLEDPSGVRILIQPGRTVSGSDDPRLGEVHVVLLDHAHGAGQAGHRRHRPAQRHADPV